MAARDVTAAAYLAGWRIVRFLPQPVARCVFNVAADLACRWGRGGGQSVEQLRRNLGRVVGVDTVTDSLVRAAMRSYARYWMEAFRLPSLASSTTLFAELDSSVQGVSGLDRSIESGRGVILTLPHSGNWDMAGVWLVHHAGTFTTVAERLKPEVLYEAFVEYRESLGFEVLALTGGQPPFSRLMEVLNQGGVVCLMGERDLKRSGVDVSFFGELTKMPAGPAELARRTGAALHVAHCFFDGDGWGFSISEEITVGEVQETVQRIADEFAVHIARHPVDWHMLQPQWLADLT